MFENFSLRIPGSLNNLPAVCGPVLVAQPVSLSPPSDCLNQPSAEAAANPASPILVGSLAAVAAVLLVLLGVYLLLLGKKRGFDKVGIKEKDD